MLIRMAARFLTHTHTHTHSERIAGPGPWAVVLRVWVRRNSPLFRPAALPAHADRCPGPGGVGRGTACCIDAPTAPAADHRNRAERGSLPHRD